jgi:hypothetical protein
MRLDDTSLDYALLRLDQIGSTLRLPSRRHEYPHFLQELRNLIQLLEYHAQPIEAGGAPTSAFFGPQVVCSHDGCMNKWSTPDACLLLRDGKWLCRDHHPPLKEGNIQPPGYHPPRSILEDLEIRRKQARDKLSRDEMRLINTRIGG